MQVKSKARVAKHGEVFTNPREVNAMLDLVADQITRIDATFLEPACGSGNFLVEILRRRMAVLNQKYGKSPTEYPAKAVQAVCGLYGIELLPDNTAECRARLFATFTADYLPAMQTADDYPHVCDTVRRVLTKNIVCGNALTYQTESGQPITFIQWQFIDRARVKAKQFELQATVETTGGRIGSQHNLFGDNGEPARIVQHKKEFPPVHYLEIGHESA